MTISSDDSHSQHWSATGLLAAAAALLCLVVAQLLQVWSLAPDLVAALQLGAVLELVIAVIVLVRSVR